MALKALSWRKIHIIAHSGHIKGLNNIFLSGQWLQPPGGLPVAVVTGKDTIMRLCKREKQIFISTMLSFEA